MNYRSGSVFQFLVPAVFFLIAARACRDTNDTVLGKFEDPRFVVIANVLAVAKTPQTAGSLTFTDLGRWAYNYRRSGTLSAMAVTMDCAFFCFCSRLEHIKREASNTMLAATIDFPFPDICEAWKFIRPADQ